MWYRSSVALGLRLRVTNTQDRNMIERTFDRFPVRIGRNPLNDFQIDSPFVSQFHAVLELTGNTLMLRDLGSKNGTSLRGSGKVASHQVVDLGPSNYEFAISSLFFQRPMRWNAKSYLTGSFGSNLRSRRVMSAAMAQPGDR